MAILGNAVRDIPVYLGTGGGLRRVDDFHVAVRLWSLTGPITRAYLPLTTTSSSAALPTDDQLPIEGTFLIAEVMGNHPPQRDQLRIDVSSLPSA